MSLDLIFLQVRHESFAYALDHDAFLGPANHPRSTNHHLQSQGTTFKAGLPDKLRSRASTPAALSYVQSDPLNHTSLPCSILQAL